MLATYIKESWGMLTRNTLDVALDPKVIVKPDKFRKM
jgi:hypothetical protein